MSPHTPELSPQAASAAPAEALPKPPLTAADLLARVVAARDLVAYSRHDDTPRHLLIELNADGTDYAVLQSGVEAALGDSWPAVLHALSEAHSKLTRQEILDNWPADYPKPDSTTLWRWLSRAVAAGIVRQEGTGRPRDPFRYWLPEREEFMCPRDGRKEALQAWNARCVEEAFARLEGTGAVKPASEMSIIGNEEPSGVGAVAAVLAEVMPPDMGPAPEPGAQSADAGSLSAEPLLSQAEQSVAAKSTLRLPYPFNLMNPGDVPEEVWEQARRGQGEPR